MYRIRIVIFVTVLLPILVGLGIWQYSRYQDKLAIEDEYQARRTGSFTVQDLQTLDDPRFYPLSLSGQFNNNQYFLLDNKTYQGRVGFHVLMPFTTRSGETILVDRGWIAGLPDRSRLPEVSSVEGFVSISGQSWQPAGEAFLLEEDKWQNEWPKVIQALDAERMQVALNTKIQPWFLVLDSDQPSSLQKNYSIINMPPSKHLGYSIQWFAMAFALLLLGVWAYRKEPHTNNNGANNTSHNNNNNEHSQQEKRL
ncbi:SURF1 family protein [Parendozoicomonas haliclonae]|uniref:SURF1-like protein n=1 Tax=Parendozoicomonas haliclonae TaxID=1960125 RepID=A0A1X7AJQ2_9GAMM|nr:SURF1 family protein [Parendozoicomonas haliclonae]SMA46275.1 SURF1 family protein [Parendozoicomonas haliclonae]